MAYTKQEAFGIIWKRFVEESRGPSVDVDSTGDPLCVYRGENGARCPIGCLLPNERYTPEMEGHNVETLITSFECDDLFAQEDLKFYVEIQNLHDENFELEGPKFTKKMLSGLLEIASKQDLLPQGVTTWS